MRIRVGKPADLAARLKRERVKRLKQASWLLSDDAPTNASEKVAVRSYTEALKAMRLERPLIIPQPTDYGLDPDLFVE